ncbi:hypothetical protein [Pseudoduganella violaceinigra]|uniref:hypothetical protein n=1 Tax=Pseudoduganella violaceinigra TaxID=246602 RepID=UPI00048889BE|nr:hypothetical protein [Pseudoduganella violaceinigra]
MPINFKQVISGVVTIAFVIIWVGVTPFSELAPKWTWFTPEAKKFVDGELLTFCEKIKLEGGCSDPKTMGKQYWIASSPIDLPGERVDEILVNLGWTESAKSAPTNRAYCKGEYTSKVDQPSGRAISIAFLGGSYSCATR